MPTVDFSSINWPTPVQLLLLKASLASGDAAEEAWRAWQRAIDLDDVDASSMRMLPLLLHNLGARAAADPCVGRYQGIARRTWYENQLIFARAAEALQLLHSAGIRTLLLKGLPLAHLHYPSPSLRAMADIDVVVPFEQLPQAVAALRANGWSPENESVVKIRPVQFEHSWTFRKPGGCDLDLHWRVDRAAFDTAAEQAFWDGSEPFTLRGVETRVLNDTDQLFHTCLHGAIANLVPPFRWVADAAMILRRGRVDWDRFIQHAEQRKYGTVLYRTTLFLAERAELPIPADVRRRLEPLSHERWQQWEMAARSGFGAWRSRAICYVCNFERQYHTYSPWRGCFILSAYVSYLTIFWDLESPWKIPGRVLLQVRTIAARVARKVLRRESVRT